MGGRSTEGREGGGERVSIEEEGMLKLISKFRMLSDMCLQCSFAAMECFF